MSYELVGITVLWIFLYGYIIVGSIDFGAGFYNFYAKLTKKDHVISKVIDRYLSPVWEVTNVFLVFFFIGIVGFFPDTAFYYGTALLVPGSIATILLAIRGAYYAFHHYGAKQTTFFQFLYGMTGLFIPASLSVVLTLSEGGFITVENEQVLIDYNALLTSPYSWSVVVLAIVSVLYISSFFLSYYAKSAKDEPAFELVRKYALTWSLPTILASFLVFFALSRHNPVHFQNMLSMAWIFILSFLFFCGAVYLLWKRKNLGTAFILVMLQFAAAFFGYGATHLPYILYPYLTIYSSFTNPAMATALVTAFIGGLLMLIPSLYLLMRLFLFNNKYVQGK
ncbi:cytochrome d ubiquinol oxidase subunit II [Bacillus lacus]|uniref:Cytochrome d ubiquinol oxidase subunit II n=1 Tax=Metabacillus lacus TaxID=1983721 RepID=A0A7X2IYL0_9BACI|nr:cytochrome d ubiquinol oxidase subunit II [Metabacillus lacus]MRX71862.1 cytochrome d ubiquinol oxidase subunit II [Metabacillus lacus]